MADRLADAMARKAIERLDPGMLREALELGAKVGALGSSADTALTRLATVDMERSLRTDSRAALMARMLLLAGADPNEKSQAGDTPLTLAARGCALGLCRELLAAGADPTQGGADGETPASAARNPMVRLAAVGAPAPLMSAREKEPVIELLEREAERREIERAAGEAGRVQSRPRARL